MRIQQAPGSDAESEPNRSPNRIRTRERQSEPNPTVVARKPNRIRFLDAETEPNPVFGPAKRTEFELRIWNRIPIRTPPTRVICRYIFILVLSTDSHHERFPSEGWPCHSLLRFCARSIYIGTRSTCIICFTPLCTSDRVAQLTASRGRCEGNTPTVTA